MSMVSNLQNLITSIGSQFKSVKTMISGSATGDVSGLATTATNLVGAINEVRTVALSGASPTTSTVPEGTNLYFTNARADARVQAAISDTTTTTTSLWSSTKTSSEISAAVAATVASAPAALDTLNELAAALGNDANFATTISTGLGNRVRVDAAQSLTGPQQLQGRQNIDAAAVADLGSDFATHNFVTDFTAALA